MALVKSCKSSGSPNSVMGIEIDEGKYFNSMTNTVSAYTSGTAISLSAFSGALIINVKNASTVARSATGTSELTLIAADGTSQSAGIQTSIDVTSYDWVLLSAGNWTATVTITD